jgi:putative DNA primase/helicase
MTDARTIAAKLGGQVVGANRILCPGPGHSPRDRSLAVMLDPRAPDGFLCCSHAGDDWRDCRDHVRQRLGLPDWQPGDGRQRKVPSQHVPKWDLAAIESELRDIPPPWTEDDLARIGNARLLWDEGVDPHGTLAEKYLHEARSLELPDALANTVLRFHPRCPWRNENTGNTDLVPALIVPFRSISDNEITAIHRIALTADGTKIGRRMLGIVARAAVKLDQISGDALAISEGVETAMAVRELMGLKKIATMPVWALGSAGAISFFPLIGGITTLYVLGENNDGGANARAVELCRTRWRKTDRRVRVIKPNQSHDDLNDALMTMKARTPQAVAS